MLGFNLIKEQSGIKEVERETERNLEEIDHSRIDQLHIFLLPRIHIRELVAAQVERRPYDFHCLSL